MTKVTGGVVSIEDGTKKSEEYAPARKVRIELHFDVPEGEDADAHIGGVSDLAQKHLSRQLGNKAVLSPPPATGAKAALEAELVAKGAKPELLGRGEPAAVASGPKRTKKTDAPAAKAQAPTPLEKATVEAQVDPDELTGAPEVKDDLDDLLGDAPKVEPVSDLELNNAIQKKNATLKSPPTIRKLIQSFNDDLAAHPQIVVAQIPQARRNEFLTKLEALTAE